MNRVVSVIRSLSIRGLSLRATNETFGNDNNGNFLGCLELLAEYDPFLAGHIEKYAVLDVVMPHICPPQRAMNL